MDLNFAASSYPPLALGFFGLGTGYLIYGPQELFGWPARDERVDRSTGIWGIWLPGFCQFVTGIILFIGLTWFNVFKEAPLYMAALAFTAYGIHWFAIGYNRWQRADPRPNAGMTVAFTVISVTGLLVFFIAGDWPVGLLFCGLALIYISDFFASIGVGLGERSLGFWHLLTGAWLMYLTFATAMNFAVHWHLPL
ncbi:hypothetical protein [Intrasporangium chromatireducens]|uniref:hypothetical protein n=1 Tax=Intrasporangium chromatireducens TaxID=1386088 RepID=UPI0004B5D63A|nr:hypothetical protein [Intrasporangium chromatireducens]